MSVGAGEVQGALGRVAAALRAGAPKLTELDQAVGDGDLGITAEKTADALETHATTPPDDDSGDDPSHDLGAYLVAGGMAVNRVASSTMGTLLATAMLRAGRAVKGKTSLDPEDLGAMLTAAYTGMQERGKAKLGDKTILDALGPAATAFNEAVAQNEDAQAAGTAALEAARVGLESVTPLRSRIGRAGWVGERTEGQIDPGCAALVIILEALVSS